MADKVQELATELYIAVEMAQGDAHVSDMDSLGANNLVELESFVRSHMQASREATAIMRGFLRKHRATFNAARKNKTPSTLGNERR